MNNAHIAFNSIDVNDPAPHLAEREAGILKIIEAVRAVASTREWSSLKELVFDGEIQRLENELLHESLKDEPNPYKTRFIAGKLDRAKQYDLNHFEMRLRMELKGIRKLLYGKEE